jgi:hypothetical protein
MARIGELEVGQDLKFEKHWWVIERCGWLVVLLILIAAVLGFFGPGLLTKKTAGQQGGPLWLEYSRYERNAKPIKLLIHLSPSAIKENELQLWIDGSYIEAMKVQRIEPEPESVKLEGDRFVYTFKARDLSSTSKILFHVEPDKFGTVAAGVGLVNGPEVRFNQFVYP